MDFVYCPRCSTRDQVWVYREYKTRTSRGVLEALKWGFIITTFGLALIIIIPWQIIKWIIKKIDMRNRPRIRETMYCGRCGEIWTQEIVNE